MDLILTFKHNVMELPQIETHGKFKKPISYKDLGWSVNPGNNHDLKLCQAAGHTLKTYDNSANALRGTNIVHVCEICMFIFHIDLHE